MAPFSLPPGFGFHPTDEELVAYYLKRKVHGHKIELDIIPEVDLYKIEPWDLPDKICLPSKDLQWHFFSPRDRKYPNGSRTNRATEAGYWKATGKDRKVTSQRSTIGSKKTLVFYRGRAPFGERTDWVMHEYRLDEKQCQAAGLQDSFVLCRVVKKNGLVTKSGDQSVAPTEKNDSDGADNSTLPGNLAQTFYTEHQSPVLQEGENNTNLKLPSETSSENFNDMTEDSIERWLDVLLDDPDQNCSMASPVELTNNAKVDIAQEVQQVISCPLNRVQDLDWIPADVDFNMPGDLEYCQLSDTLETSFEEAEIIEEIFHTAQASQADNTEAGYLLYSDNFDDIWRAEELGDNFVPSLEGLEYHDTSMVPTGNHTNPEVTGIQLRQRRQICQQELPYEGTAMKRVRMQKYPVQHSAIEHQQDGCTAYPENDYVCDLQEQLILLETFNGQNHNSKNITMLQDPVPLASARQINDIREGPLAKESLGMNRREAHSGRGVGSSFSRDNSQPGSSSIGFRQSNEDRFNFPLHDSLMEGELPANEIQRILHGSEFDVLPNSSDLSDKVTVNHVKSSMPPQSLRYGLFLNSQSSQIVDIPAESPTQTMKHEPGNSLEIWKSQQRMLTSLAEDKMPISKTNCRTSLSEDGQLSTVAVVKECEFTPSEDDSETPEKLGEPSKGKSSGEVPDSSGASSRVLHLEKILPAPSSSEPTSVKGGWKISGRILKFCSSIPSYAAPVMEYLGRFNPMKASLPSESACNIGPTDGAAVSAGNIGTCMCTEGNMEHARSNIFLSQLKQRVKPKVKSVMPDSGEKSGDAMQKFCHRCADQGSSVTLHGLEQPSGVLNGFSEFWSRCAPTSPTSVIVSLCLLGTTSLLFLFLLFRAIWRFARSIPAIIF